MRNRKSKRLCLLYCIDLIDKRALNLSINLSAIVPLAHLTKNMLQLRYFTFNPFQENTYLLYTDNKEAVIVDPGMYNAQERSAIKEFIKANDLNLVKLLNTHTHIDHVFGNHFIFNEYGLKPWLHKEDEVVLQMAERSAEVYQLDYDHSSEIEGYLTEGDEVKIGDAVLKCLFVPGHSPGHLVFVNEEGNFAIGGDVLFRGSIGRTDLPGGDHETLLSMIREKIFTLPENMTIYPGHGDPTTVGYEKENNPFF